MNYTAPGCNLSFKDYIHDCRTYIKTVRTAQDSAPLESIATLNSPFEFNPNVDKKHPIGLLFIHGLLDSPFTMRDLADRFFEQEMLCRGVLLPGHGTTPEHLLHIHYQDWIKAVDYGIETLRSDAEKIFLVGYSTGATLSLYHALRHDNIAGMILIAPAIKIKFPADPLMHLLPYLTWTNKRNVWIKKENEIDYAKYLSISYHAVCQVSELTKQLPAIMKPSCPIFVVVSDDDETISSTAAIRAFQKTSNPKSKLLIYTPHPKKQNDPRITERNSYFPDQHIDHFSHRCLPFSPTNPHYGINGDYAKRSHVENGKRYGAYIGFLGHYYALLHKLQVTREIRQELTYNPDFDCMSDELIAFVRNCV